MLHLRAVAILLPALVLFAAGCDEGVSPEEVCAHGEKFAGEEAAAAEHGSAEAAKHAREEAHRACVAAQEGVKRGTDSGKWSKYSRCMVGKHTRAEQKECEAHVR